MHINHTNYKNIDEYIKMFPENTQTILDKVRKIIRKVIPQSTEAISYGVPTYKVNGKNIIHFAGYTKHISIYPGEMAIEYFKDKLNGYKTSKGTVQFPLDKPIPYDLITEIVEHCSRHTSK